MPAKKQTRKQYGRRAPAAPETNFDQPDKDFARPDSVTGISAGPDSTANESTSISRSTPSGQIPLPEQQTLKQFKETLITQRLQDAQAIDPTVTREEAAYGVDSEAADLHYEAMVQAAEAGRTVSQKALDSLSADRLEYFVKRHAAALPAGYMSADARKANAAYEEQLKAGRKRARAEAPALSTDGKTQTTISLSDAMFAKAKQNAEADGRSLSNYIEQLLKALPLLALIAFLALHVTRSPKRWDAASLRQTAAVAVAKIHNLAK